MDNENSPQESQSAAVARRSIPFVTLLICTACIVVYAGLQTEPKRDDWPTLIKWGCYPPDLIWGGRYWALVTSVFVHLELWHVAFNVYWLFVFAKPIERQMGPLRFALFVLGAACFSSAAEFAFTSSTGIGASGVGYALFGFIWLQRKAVPEFAEVLKPKLIVWFLVWLVGCIMLTAAHVFEVANGAHIAGLAFGAAMACRSLKLSYNKAIHWAFVTASLALAVPLFWAPWSFSWTSLQGTLAQEKGNMEAAIKWYQRSMDLGQDKAWCLASMAPLYAWKGDEAEFKKTLNALRALDRKEADRIEIESNSYWNGKASDGKLRPASHER